MTRRRYVALTLAALGLGAILAMPAVPESAEAVAVRIPAPSDLPSPVAVPVLPAATSRPGVAPELPLMTNPAHTWRVLVLAYSTLDVSWPLSACGPAAAVKVGDGYPEDGRMKRGKSPEYRAALGAVQRLPEVVRQWSRGRVGVTQTLVEVGHELTSITVTEGCQYWPAPEDVRVDLERYGKGEPFDAVFVLWPDVSDFTSTNEWGLTIGPTDAANGAAYTTVSEISPMAWARGQEPAEVFVHEMLHQLIATAEARGAENLPGLHRNRAWGYEADDSGSYRTWYADYLRGLIPEGGKPADSPRLSAGWIVDEDAPSGPGATLTPATSATTDGLGLTHEVWAAIEDEEGDE